MWGNINGNNIWRVGVSRLSLYILLEMWDRDEETSQNCAAPRGREAGEQGCKKKPRTNHTSSSMMEMNLKTLHLTPKSFQMQKYRHKPDCSMSRAERGCWVQLRKPSMGDIARKAIITVLEKIVSGAWLRQGNYCLSQSERDYSQLKESLSVI